MVSLDAVLSCLETNGVLIDRPQAVRLGIEGIVKSIDPGAFLGLASGAEAVITQAVDSVECWPEDLAYVKLRGLIGGSGQSLLAKLHELERKAGIILDFRDAAGDDLASVSVLAGLAYPEAVPLYIVTDNQGRALSTNRVETAVAIKVPIMLLIDNRTRGASEALAALLKGRPGIMLIGDTTVGEARFRDMVTLPDGQILTVATRKFVPAQGDSYEGSGVKPDVRVVDDGNNVGVAMISTNRPMRPLSEKSERDLDLMKRVHGDATLQRATDILLGLKTLCGYGQ